MTCLSQNSESVALIGRWWWEHQYSHKKLWVIFPTERTLWRRKVRNYPEEGRGLEQLTGTLGEPGPSPGRALICLSGTAPAPDHPPPHTNSRHSLSKVTVAMKPQASPASGQDPHPH